MTKKRFLSQSFHKTLGVHLPKAKDVEGSSILKNKGRTQKLKKKPWPKRQNKLPETWKLAFVHPSAASLFLKWKVLTTTAQHRARNLWFMLLLSVKLRSTKEKKGLTTNSDVNQGLAVYMTNNFLMRCRTTDKLSIVLWIQEGLKFRKDWNH